MATRTTVIKNGSEIQAVAKRMVDFADRAPERFHRTMWEAVLLFEQEVVERTPVGVGNSTQGHLSGTIFSDVNGSPADHHFQGIVASFSEYVLPVEFGSRPHMIPIDALAEWVRLKLGISEPDNYKVAWAIAIHKKRHGTPPVGMFADGWEASEKRIQQLFERTFRELADEFNRTN